MPLTSQVGGNGAACPEGVDEVSRVLRIGPGGHLDDDRTGGAVDVWSQLIMKEPGEGVERILAAPHTGAWHLTDGGGLTFDHVSNDWHDITTEDEAFFMRVYAPGDFKFHGADLGILVTKGRMQTADGLTDRCRRYIEGIRAQYHTEAIPNAPAVMPLAYVK